MQRGGQRCLGFGQAFAATGADPKFTSQIAHTIRAAFDSGSDLSV
jgi:hypothetical protein